MATKKPSPSPFDNPPKKKPPLQEIKTLKEQVAHIPAPKPKTMPWLDSLPKPITPEEYSEWKKTYAFPDINQIEVGPNPALQDASKWAVTGSLASTPAFTPNDLYQAVNYTATMTPTTYSYPDEILAASKALPKAPESPSKTKGGQKVAPSVTKLQEQVVKLMGQVVELTHKLQKVTADAETTYMLASNSQSAIAKLSAQLTSHTHPMPSIQIQGMSLYLPMGQPPVING